jgi:hypothetical protein
MRDTPEGCGIWILLEISFICTEGREICMGKLGINFTYEKK